MPDVNKLLTYVFERDAPLPEAVRLDLTEGIFIGVMPEYLLSADDDRHVIAIRPGFSRFFQDHMHKSTLNVAYCGKSDLSDEGIKSNEGAAKRNIDHYLLSGMVFSPRFRAPYASFVTIPDEERICHSSRMMDFGRFELSNSSVLNEADFTSINRLYGPIKKVLSDDKTGRIHTALRYYQQSFRSDIDSSIRFLGMMMAMEALFSQGVATEIAHQVSERVAFFSTELPVEREKLYKQMKSHYDVRSKIAHGGGMGGKPNWLEESFPLLLDILRRSLTSILEELPLLTLFRSGEKKQFDEAMRTLIFRGTLL